MKSPSRANDDRALCILIAALGGEGGGVLADWIVDAALAQGLPVQATSVPGVAQRTGATSYYIELMRSPSPEGLQPVFSLSPMPGGVDVVVASELLEAARVIERGFVNPTRTTLIAARHRVFTTLEKMQMGDGRFDEARIHDAARGFALRYLSLDMEALALRYGTAISAVMFGALAGSGALPWSRQVCETAIRRSGVGVEPSLAGFAAGFDAVAQAAITTAIAQAPSSPGPAPEIWAPLIATLPAAVQANAAHGVVRLIDWQDGRWARNYLERLQALSALAPNHAAHPVLAEVARQLALWMSYEDLIRVADLKTRATRFERIRSEAGVGGDQVLEIVDYLKPGYEEIAAVLPRRLGGSLRRWASRRRKNAVFERGMNLSTSSVSGYLALRLLARLRPLRRHSLRLHEEREAIERWLAAVGETLPHSPDLARAIAGLPRLLKGYGETWQRGLSRYQRIFETLVEPARAKAADAAECARYADLIRAAIDAALADPEGRKLENSLASAGIEALPPKAKPIVWMRKPRGEKSGGQIGENSGAAP